jgi:hypothetical protein
LALGEVDAVEFQHDFAPEAEGLGFVEDKVEAAAHGAPFALENAPGGVGGAGDLVRRGLAGAGLRSEIGVLVFDARRNILMDGSGCGQARPSGARAGQEINL